MRPPEFIDTAKANLNNRRESYSGGLNLDRLFRDRSEIVHPSYFQAQSISADVSKEVFELEQKCDSLEKRYEEELLARANDIRDKQNLKKENQKLKEQVLYWKSKFEAIFHQDTEVINEPVKLIDTGDTGIDSKSSLSKRTYSPENKSSIPANNENRGDNSFDKKSPETNKSIPEIPNESLSTSEAKTTEVQATKNNDGKTDEEMSRKERKRQRKEKRRQEREERRNARLSKESFEKIQPVQTVDCSVVLSPIKTSTRIDSPLKSQKSNETNLFDQILDDLEENSEKENTLSIGVSDEDEGPPKKQKKAPHICHVCGKEWETNYKLKRHVETHNKTKPYKCNSCPAKFKTPKDKSRHEGSVHNGSVTCGYCLANFRSEIGLKHHQKNYH